nr:aspartyl-phosphate phosphatase Spo0E family protein [Cytobacillus eiseniae]
MDNYVEELFKIYMQRGIQHHETIKISEKLDEIIIQYQKLKLIN